MTDPPARGDRSERPEDEGASLELRMGDCQPARAELSAAPQCDVEIEHARSPSTAGAASKLPLQPLQALQHLRRLVATFDQGNAIRKVASSFAMRGVEHDRGGIEQAELFVQPCYGRLDYCGGAAVASVRPVGADGDGVEVRCLSHAGSPR